MATGDLWKNFIRSNDDPSLNQRDRTLNDLKTDQEGNSVREFYETIIASTPQSNVSEKVIKPKPYKRRSERIQKQKLAPSVNEFFVAADSGNVEILKQFLFSGGNVNIKDSYGWTALMCSSANGHVNCVKFLLSSGADKTITDKSKSSALTIAKKLNHNEVVKLLQQCQIKSEQIETRLKVKLKVQPAESSAKKSFYCEVCKEKFSVDKALHLKSTRHLLSEKPKGNLLPPYHISESNVGFQMLLKSGWDKEKGLGPDGSGRTIPIKTVLKRNRKGFGLEKKLKARVTHFAARNEMAVKDERAGFKVSDRKLREQKRLQDKWKEIKYRRMFYDF